MDHVKVLSFEVCRLGRCSERTAQITAHIHWKITLGLGAVENFGPYRSNARNKPVTDQKVRSSGHMGFHTSNDMIVKRTGIPCQYSQFSG